MSRVAGPGGSWQYTLYDGGTVYRYGKPGEPFVHALDTVGERTLCIDLDWIRPGRVDRIDLRMSADGSEVEVVDPIEGVVGRIDTATGEAREVSEPFGATTAEGGSGGRTLGIRVAIGSIAAGLGLLALLAGGGDRRGPPWTARSPDRSRVDNRRVLFELEDVRLARGGARSSTASAPRSRRA